MKKFLKSFLFLNPRSITFGLTVLILILFFVGIPFLDIIELKSYDLRFLPSVPAQGGEGTLFQGRPRSNR